MGGISLTCSSSEAFAVGFCGSHEASERGCCSILRMFSPLERFVNKDFCGQIG